MAAPQHEESKMHAVSSSWARRLVIAIPALIGLLAPVAVTAQTSGSNHSHSQADVVWSNSVPLG